MAVHPDDESIAAAGLIRHAVACGATVGVVFITDGENNPWPQRFVERRWHIDAADRARWGQRRRAEALEALAGLGLPEKQVQFWGFPDQGITGILMAGGSGLLRRLASLIDGWRPTVVVGPSKEDRHPDHNSLALVLAMALARSPAPSGHVAVWNYLVHAPAATPRTGAVHFFLPPRLIAAKRRAILSHRTQMALCQARFLAHARPVESFLRQDEAVLEEGSPFRAAELLGEELILRTHALRRPATIALLADTPSGPIGVRVQLPLVGLDLVSDWASGEILGRAVIRPDHSLVLPAETFASATAISVKLAAGCTFFDRSGWQRFPLPPSLGLQRERQLRRPRICCVIPCYNTAGVCGTVIREALHEADSVIAVNDGSTDETENVLRAAADENPGHLRVLSFARNRGKGFALTEAFRAALDGSAFDALITLDGDGQHRPEDMTRLASTLVRGRYSLVIGERLARSRMPLRSRFGNTLTSLIMRAFYRASPADTQSGYRALHPALVREIAQNIEGGRYETELKMLLFALTRRHRIGSVAIPTVYLDNNRLSHFRPLLDSWTIYRTLLSWRCDKGGLRGAAISADYRPGA